MGVVVDLCGNWRFVLGSIYSLAELLICTTQLVEFRFWSKKRFAKFYDFFPVLAHTAVA